MRIRRVEALYRLDSKRGVKPVSSVWTPISGPGVEALESFKPGVYVVVVTWRK